MNRKKRVEICNLSVRPASSRPKVGEEATNLNFKGKKIESGGIFFFFFKFEIQSDLLI